jgi:hypothetical protein
VALFAAVSLRSGAFAAHVYLRASEDRAVAAQIVCVAYGLRAITIRAVALARRHAASCAARPWRHPEMSIRCYRVWARRAVHRTNWRSLRRCG